MCGDGDGIGSTHWHVCTECLKPCDIAKPTMKEITDTINILDRIAIKIINGETCIRCDKLVKGEHTCTPTHQYRAGIVEGLKLAQHNIEEEYSKNDAATMSVIAYHDVTVEIIEELIKQYSGEEC
jgi:hypothetical protein